MESVRSKINFLINNDVDFLFSDNPVDKTKLVVKNNQQVAKQSAVISVEKKSDKLMDLVIEKEVCEFSLKDVSDLESFKKVIVKISHLTKSDSSNIVFGKGNNKSPKVMFIGEIPDIEEETSGTPFAGSQGVLLEKMLKAIGLKQDDFYLTNAVNYHPLNNQILSKKDLEFWAPFLKKHIELINPKIIYLFGLTPLQMLFPNSGNLVSNRGKLLDLQGVKSMCSYHPSYLVRIPEKKKEAWEDLQMLQKELV